MEIIVLRGYTHIIALNIRDPKAKRLAAALARQTGESKTEAPSPKRSGTVSPECGANAQSTG